MSIDLVRDIASWFLILGGSFLFVVGAIGINRMPDVFTRLHAVSLSETIGSSLILLGLILEEGFTLVTAKLVMLVLFLLFSGPVATHALARAALHDNLRPLGVDETRPPQPKAEGEPPE